MIKLTNLELEFIAEVLESCQAEFEVLSRDREWFTTSVLERIEEALEIIEGAKRCG